MSDSLSMLSDQGKVDRGKGLRAVIYLGAGAIQLMVTNRSDDQSEVVDVLSLPIPLGRDIFRDGRISHSTIERCVSVIQSFQEVLAEYGVTDRSDLHLTGVNILSEAENKEVFINRIQVALGLTIEPLDDGEMTRLIYLKTRESLRDFSALGEKNVLIVHVGPGNTRVLLFRNGRIAHYSNYRLGVYRSGEVLEFAGVGATQSMNIIREHARGQLDQLKVDLRSFQIDDIIFIGAELQSLGLFFHREGETHISIQAMRRFAERVAAMSVSERIHEFNTDYAAVDALLPALVINIAIAETLNCKHMNTPNRLFDRSLMFELLDSDKLIGQGKLQGEILHYVETLADKYKTDKNHRHQVSLFALKLFEKLQFIHGLKASDRLLLQAAASLHQIGTYISPRQHHKHGHYIILNTDVFGLNRRDVSIIAQLVQYHRHEIPHVDDEDYRNLSAEDRLRVSKLTAILRLAVALDRSHSQRIKNIEPVVRGNYLEIVAEGVSDTTVEEIAMQTKSDLFMAVFGLNVRVTPGF